jgi:hypothetical protein
MAKTCRYLSIRRLYYQICGKLQDKNFRIAGLCSRDLQRKTIFSPAALEELP